MNEYIIAIMKGKNLLMLFVLGRYFFTSELRFTWNQD
jgi:hypothetical protein